MPLPLGIPAVGEVEELQKALDSVSASGSSLCSAGLAPVATSINRLYFNLFFVALKDISLH